MHILSFLLVLGLYVLFKQYSSVSFWRTGNKYVSCEYFYLLKLLGSVENCQRVLSEYCMNESVHSATKGRLVFWMGKCQSLNLCHSILSIIFRSFAMFLSNLFRVNYSDKPRTGISHFQYTWIFFQEINSTTSRLLIEWKEAH